MSQLLNSSSQAYTVAAYLRIASIAIAGYDYLETLPSSWRFYKEQWELRTFTLSSLLFILIRITSIVVLAISNVGFFYSHFTETSCRRFFLLPPAFKVLQAMVSQAILGIRAFNLSQRNRKIGCLLVVVYSAACILQWVTTLYQRTAHRDEHYGNCRAFNEIRQLGAWIYYAVAIIYDVLTTAISVIFLLKYKLSSTSSVMSKVTNMMLYDGLGYFVALTAVNVLNLILYRTSQDIQTAGASLGYCVAWIMSQRLLIHLRQASRERRNESIDAAITITQHIGTARDVSRAMRSQYERKSNAAFDLTVPDFDLNIIESYPELPDGVDVEVRIERTVMLERRSRTYELEDYSRNARISRDRYA